MRLRLDEVRETCSVGRIVTRRVLRRWEDRVEVALSPRLCKESCAARRRVRRLSFVAVACSTALTKSSLRRAADAKALSRELDLPSLDLLAERRALRRRLVDPEGRRRCDCKAREILLVNKEQYTVVHDNTINKRTVVDFTTITVGGTLLRRRRERLDGPPSFATAAAATPSAETTVTDGFLERDIALPVTW